MIVLDSPFAVAETVRTALLASLDECERDPISMSYVGVGEAVWDDICGMLVVGVERVYGASEFPAEDDGRVICDAPWIALTIVVVLVRCVPVANERGRVPTADDTSAAFKSLYDDAAVIWNRMVEGFEDWDHTTPSQTYITPNGAGVAVETRMTIGVPAVQWCVQCPPPEIDGGDGE